ncbi:MAG: hypothetical protein LC799_21380 [Actinobacteria bacterium]|jgi:hypothetical protein|nr:hypothetical protein [Actinomycetota bacterium]
MADINEELAVQYAMARRARPTATADEIAERITERLGDDEHLALAEEALLWSQEPAGRRELALMAVRNFVLAMESDPDDDPGQTGEP